MKIFNNINLLKQTKYNINVKNSININLSIKNNNKISNNSLVYTTKNFSSKTSHHKFDPFENVNISYGKHDDYEVLDRIGSGRYSQVYEGINIVKDKNVVIKVIKPVKYKKIRREVTILEILKGHENIVTLLDVIVDSSSRTPSFVFERIIRFVLERAY